MSSFITLVASEKPLGEAHLKAVTKNCAPRWLSPGKAIDIEIEEPLEKAHCAALKTALAAEKIDVFFTGGKNRRKKLLLADMDSTIVTSETLDEIAREAGDNIGAEIAAITKRAMNGELDFEGALRERVGMLRGLSVSLLDSVLTQTQLNDGAVELVRTMQKHGAVTVLVSGGFTFFTKSIAKRVGFDHHHGNVLGVNGDCLSGAVEGKILGREAKLGFLRSYADQYGLPADMTAAIGDGANDLAMLENAGLGIGFHPKALLREALDNTIDFGDLRCALYMQGYRDEDFAK